MWFVCKALGAAGAASMVEVDASDLVLKVAQLLLRKAFKATTYEAADLELFLAREADGCWLRVRDGIIRELDQGHVPPRIQAIVDQPPLSVYDRVEVHFGTAPSTDALHVLVRVAPNVVVYGSYAHAWCPDCAFSTCYPL